MIVRGIFDCFGCGESFQLSYEKGSPQLCPACKSGNIACVREDPIQMNTGEKGCNSCGCGQHSHQKKE